VTQYGFARLASAIEALDPSPTSSVSAQSAGDTLRMARSPIPPHKL